MSRERSCLISKPVINENEIEFCSFQKKHWCYKWSTFPSSLKVFWDFLALFTLNTLRWPMGTLSMCVPDIAQHRPTNQVTTSPFSKAIPEVQHSGKREKKFNLISPPLRKVVQEKMARPGWSPSNYSKSHLLQPFSAQGWLDASNCGWIGTFDALSQDTNRKLWDLSSKLDLLSVANLHNQNDEKTALCCFKCSSGRLVSLLGDSPPPPFLSSLVWKSPLKRNLPLSQFYPLLNVGSSNIPLFFLFHESWC